MLTGGCVHARALPAVVEDKVITRPYRNWELSEIFLSPIRLLRAIKMFIRLHVRFFYHCLNLITIFSQTFKKF